MKADRCPVDRPFAPSFDSLRDILVEIFRSRSYRAFMTDKCINMNEVGHNERSVITCKIPRVMLICQRFPFHSIDRKTSGPVPEH